VLVVELLNVKEKMKPLENLFGYFFLFIGIILEIVLSIGLGVVNVLLFSIPLVGFVLWTLIYIYGYRARVRFQDEHELLFIETARAYTYFFTLPISIILNVFVVFSPTFLNAILVIVVVGVALNLLILFMPRIFFFRQTSFFDKNQKAKFRKVLSYVGSVSIYYSMSLAVLDSIIAELIIQEPYEFNLSTLLLVLIIFSIPTLFIYDRERKSRKHAEILAVSLKETRWSKKYTSGKSREERRRKKARLKKRKKRKKAPDK